MTAADYAFLDSHKTAQYETYLDTAQRVAGDDFDWRAVPMPQRASYFRNL